MIATLLAIALASVAPQRTLRPGTNCWGPVEPRVYVNVSNSVGFSSPFLLSSIGQAQASDCWANVSGSLSGLHSINSNTGTPAIETISGSGMWAGTLSGSGDYNHCYAATVSASSSDGASQAMTTPTSCTEFTTPPAPPPIIADNCGGNTDFVDACSPIVINLENGPYLLTGAESPVWFDMSGSGHRRPIGWTAAGADEAFLCLDRDHDGKVDNGAELFGNFTPLLNGQNAANGFEALREFDDNHDGVIDEQDAVWWQLLLWRDLDHDGVSQPDELSPLAGSRVAAIELSYHWTGRVDPSGNAFKYEAHVRMVNALGHTEMKPVYDIFFVSIPGIE